MFFFVSDAFRVMWAEHGREIRVCALEVFLHGRFWFVCRLGKDREIVANSLAAKIVEELVLRMAVWT